MKEKINSCPQLAEYVNQIGFLPLLRSGAMGWSAEDVVDDDCQYTLLPDGGWEWLLWKWKGSILRETGCAYGKFFNGKAGFVSKDWWPDFCNYRRSCFVRPEIGSIEETILFTLREQGHLITRELRAACDFTGPNMRSKFDAYITRLEMGCYIVTEDFVYPRDRHGQEYGWGFSLLTTPETLFGPTTCRIDRSPSESRELLSKHLHSILPHVSDKYINGILR